jgi:hypothetical protein
MPTLVHLQVVSKARARHQAVYIVGVDRDVQAMRRDPRHLAFERFSDIRLHEDTLL